MKVTSSSSIVAARPLEAARAGPFAHQRPAVEQLEHTLTARTRGEQRGRQLAEVTHRAQQLGQVGEKGQQPADRQAPVLHGPCAEGDQRQQARHLDERHQAGEGPGHAGRHELGIDYPLALPQKAPALVFARVEGLHQRGVGDALLGHRAQRSAALSLGPSRLAGEPGEEARRQVERRRENDRVEGELPVKQEERAREEGDARHGRDRLAQPAEHEALDGLDVAAQAGEQVAQSPAVQRVEGEALQVGEEARAEVEEEPLPGPGPGVVLAEGERGADQREPEHHPGDPWQCSEIGGDDDLVHHNAEHPDLGRLNRGQDRHQGNTGRDGEPVGTGERPEATDELPRRHSRCRRDEPAVVLLGVKKPHRPLRCSCCDDAGDAYAACDGCAARCRCRPGAPGPPARRR